MTQVRGLGWGREVPDPSWRSTGAKANLPERGGVWGCHPLAPAATSQGGLRSHIPGVSGASAQFICTYTSPRPGGAPRDVEFASWPMRCPPQSTPPDGCSLAPGARRPSQRPPAGGRYLLVLVPGERLGRQHEPVLLGAALHDADVVDGQPAPADHLRAGGAGGSGWGEEGATGYRRPLLVLPKPPLRPSTLSRRPSAQADLETLTQSQAPALRRGPVTPEAGEGTSSSPPLRGSGGPGDVSGCTGTPMSSQPWPLCCPFQSHQPGTGGSEGTNGAPAARPHQLTQPGTPWLPEHVDPRHAVPKGTPPFLPQTRSRCPGATPGAPGGLVAAGEPPDPCL